VNIILSHGFLGVRTNTQDAQERLRRLVENPHDWRSGTGQERDRTRDPHRDGLRIADRDLLGHQLADDQRRVGHRDGDDDQRNRLRVARQQRVGRERVAKRVAKRGAAEDARDGRGGREPDLHRGEHP
jgi:hypothetical protein